MLRLWLTIVEDDQDKITLAVPPEQSLMIGRDDSINELVFHSAAVSRIHCRLAHQNGRYAVHDVHSKAGTFLNGERVAGQAILADGDLIEIGPIKLRAALREWTHVDEDDSPPTLIG